MIIYRTRLIAVSDNLLELLYVLESTRTNTEHPKRTKTYTTIMGNRAPLCSHKVIKYTLSLHHACISCTPTALPQKGGNRGLPARLRKDIGSYTTRYRCTIRAGLQHRLEQPGISLDRMEFTHLWFEEPEARHAVGLPRRRAIQSAGIIRRLRSTLARNLIS